jgi:hypothetical protein
VSTLMQRKATGLLFIVVSVLMLCCFVLLGVLLEYPEILRQGTAAVLTKYHEAGKTGPLLYYGLMISAVLVIFEAILFQRVFRDDSQSIWLELGKYSGVLAGVFFIFGFMRWVFLVPLLAQNHAADAAGVSPETMALMFQAFDTYLGFSIGEHMGFLFLSLMLAFFGLALVQSRQAPTWLGWCGLIIGLAVLYGDTEAFGLPLSFVINRTATKLSLVWMIAVGIFLLVSKAPSLEYSS